MIKHQFHLFAFHTEGKTRVKQNFTESQINCSVKKDEGFMSHLKPPRTKSDPPFIKELSIQMCFLGFCAVFYITYDCIFNWKYWRFNLGLSALPLSHAPPHFNCLCIKSSYFSFLGNSMATPLSLLETCNVNDAQTNLPRFSHKALKKML